MDLKILEDFLYLARTGSFSITAEERFSTQSTISRRIKNLENWVGVQLINRSSYPVTLTPIGEQFAKDAEFIVQRFYLARSEALARSESRSHFVTFSAQHSIARYFFLNWFKQIEEQIGTTEFYLKSDNINTCVSELESGTVDFVLCYEHPGVSAIPVTNQFKSIKIGDSMTIPVTVTNEQGTPLYQLPGTKTNPIPYMGLGPEVPLSWYREWLLTQRGLQPNLVTKREVSIGEVLKEMVLDGEGIAWLPEYIVRQDLKSGQLVVAGGEEWCVNLKVALYYKSNIINDTMKRIITAAEGLAK